MVELAEQKDVKPAQIALAWLLHKPGVTAPITVSTKCASKLYQLEEAVAAVKLNLTDE